MESGILGKIVGIGIGLFVLAIIVPPALVELADADMTGVDDSVVTVLTVLVPILAVVAIALYLLPKRGM